MELYIVRHGKTVWNKEKRIQGRSDIALLPEGREMARRTAEGLKDAPFDAIYSSPLSRAYETAEILRGDRKLEIRTDDRIMEMSFGACEGAYYAFPEQEGSALLQEFYDSPEKYQAPEKGESFFDLCSRADSFLTDLLQNSETECQSILIVAHAAINQALFGFLESREVKDFWEHERQLNCAVAIYRGARRPFEAIERNKRFYENE